MPTLLLTLQICKLNAPWGELRKRVERLIEGKGKRQEGIALHTCVMRVKMSRCCNYKQLFCYAGLEQTTTDCKCNIIIIIINIISGSIRILLFSSTPPGTFCVHLHSLIINLINKKNDKKLQSKKSCCERIC